MPDSDLAIRGREAGRSPKKLFSALRASVWSKNKGGPGPRATDLFYPLTRRAGMTIKDSINCKNRGRRSR